ncbi:putative MATE family efflux protein [Sphingomonas jinjuensis]|uniref:Putative MATE family efflux protein n=1 Tax=Sphingomonas jinjuensis TaxID=535907 RepID=A0A840F5M9_9SPHN|nr:MATE family efflux transporter [Sphingomonas jinjuensis]MBB4153089.1 putative MATE family efflux protein [Sphingomonas jinjuensis]
MANGTSPQRDLTQGPIASTLLLFALPTLGSNILQSLNGSINTIWLGQSLGEDAVAATANANIIMFLMFGAVFGFGMAATVLVGQAWGRHDVESARRAFGSAVGLIVGGSVVIATLGYLFAPGILDVLATPAGAKIDALAYLRIIFLGLPAMMTLVLMFMALRGTGDSLTPLYFMVLNVGLDVVLNPLLIRGMGPFPRMGIAGSATATLIANVVALAALVAWVDWRGLPLRLRGGELAYLKPQWTLVKTIVGKGVPIGAQMLTMSTAGLAMVGLVNRHGLSTVAAYGVTQQLWGYVQMPAMAIGAGVSAMAAQNIGAQAWDRVSRITYAGLAINVAITGAVVALVILFARPLLSIFLPAGSPALALGEHINVIAIWSFLLFGATMVLFGTVRANGAVWGPLAILFVAMFPVRLGFATMMEPRWGVDALWWSFPLGSGTALVLASIYYAKADWRSGAMMPVDENPPHAHADNEPAGALKPAA